MSGGGTWWVGFQPGGGVLSGQGWRGSLTVVVSERGVDEGRSRVEKDAEVEGGHVVGLDAVVRDGHVSVVVRPRVHIPAAVRCVQHVRETCFLQSIAVQRRGPGRREKGRSVGGRCALGGARLSSLDLVISGRLQAKTQNSALPEPQASGHSLVF